jgi:hypothetical protein
MVLPALVLQKPFKTSKSKERRMKQWKDGNFLPLLEEAKVIQARLTQSPQNQHGISSLSQRFSDLMKRGKLKQAMRLISKGDTKVLPLDDLVDEAHTVRDVLMEKHPNGQSLHQEAISHPVESSTHAIIYDEIDGAAILKSALKTEGGAGPSGLDAYAWKRMCSSFQKVSSDLCAALAACAKRISCQYVDPEPLKPLQLTSYRLVALDKCPGVRPIGVGEVARKIMSRCILSVVQSDILETVGSRQLCIGQKCGCEAAIHALNEVFNEEQTEGVLLVDASNAFNNLNRKAALVNAINLCPSIAKVLVNTYRSDPNLFIDGECIQSKEGTTQGDPLAMAMYAIATLPLIHQLDQVTAIEQIWYADDSSAAGSVSQIRTWWDKIEEMGPAYGYFVNPMKSWLVVKEEFLEDAKRCFQDTEIKVTTTGRNYLGSAIGGLDFTEAYVSEKVSEWEAELKKLTTIAMSQPQAAYSALVHSLKNKWSYLLRTTKDIGHLLQPIEDVLRHDLIPAITGQRAISDEERELFALPTRLGGLGIEIMPKVADHLFTSSQAITHPLKEAIRLKAENNYTLLEQVRITRQIKAENHSNKKRMAEEVRSTLSDETFRKAMSLAEEKGASAWLDTMPIDEHAWLFIAQGCFSRCTRIEVWLETQRYACYLRMWQIQ